MKLREVTKMEIDVKILAVILGVIFTNIVAWCVYVSMTLTKIQHSIKYMNANLRLIDWEKVPKKNLNDVI